MVSHVIHEIWKEVEMLHEEDEATLNRKLDTVLLALGGLFWEVAKDKQHRGELSAEDKLIFQQTANYLRKVSNPDAPFLPL